MHDALLAAAPAGMILAAVLALVAAVIPAAVRVRHRLHQTRLTRIRGEASLNPQGRASHRNTK